jgi:hypothetical protein
VKKVDQNVGYLSIFSKYLPKVNNRPMGENSPNLVTLLPSLVWFETVLLTRQ